MTFPFVQKITATLVAEYGKQDLGNKNDPFDELLFIILSSKTPPYRYVAAFEALSATYWREQLAEISVDDLAKTIQFAGLERKKARQIIGAAQITKELFGYVTLDPIREMTDERAENLLLTLPGIGYKSARCIMMYSLGRAVFPADNHCLRIATRLEWIEEPAFSTRVANRLQSGIPPELRHDLHVGMILLGRDKCLPRLPICDSCPIVHYCPTGRKNTHQ